MEKSFDELMREHWAEGRKSHLRRITYIVGDEEREGYVEIDDLEQKFIPIRESEMCGSKIAFVNQDCIREYRLEALSDNEQVCWDATVDYEAEFGYPI